MNAPTSESSVTTKFRIALVGNPNVGKTSVFNRLTDLHAKTSNFVGTTVEHRTGTLEHQGRTVEIVDLPGLFSLEGDSPEEQVAKDVLAGKRGERPNAALVIVDSTNLKRSLFIAAQTIDLGLPTIVAVNLIDAARHQGTEIDLELLSQRLRCEVIAVSARSGEGFDELRSKLSQLEPISLSVLDSPVCGECTSCPYAHGHNWSTQLATEVSSSADDNNTFTDKMDGWLTNPWLGPILFGMTMTVVFALVFWLATFPMDWIEMGIGALGGAVSNLLPEGDINSLITDGIIGGVGSVVVFLPQICILFFALTLLEDSGYLSRAVVVVDRWMRRVGLPGQAFVPMLTAHACAIPAIMSTRVVSNRRDRLATIMVIPLMTCSARLPVYAMVAALLFPGNALSASFVFVGAYVLGMATAFLVAWLLKLSILTGEASLLVLDLPAYRRPSVRAAALHAYRRGLAFLRDAGSVILIISILIWGLSTYPKLPDATFQQQLAERGVNAGALDELQLNAMRMQFDQEYSVLGRAGKLVEPIFRPIGYDWKTSVGVLASFAAREVVVSTLSVLYGLGDESEDISTLQEKLSAAAHPDGTPVFDTATCVSLLVFFVLAMQCLPTQAVTKKETGSWGWAVFQFSYMSVLAYVAAWIAYNIVRLLT